MLLGKGTLGWTPEERRTDRYGAIHLSYDSDPETFPHVPVGLTGSLVATVIETKRSTHFGDFFRGIGPTKPEVGDRIVLGEGTLFTEVFPSGLVTIGVKPLDGREYNWMDPECLYRCHNQVVELRFFVGVGNEEE